MALSETHSRNDVPWTFPSIPGYTHWRWERSEGDKGGGGLCILYREHLHPHRWIPVIPESLKYLEKERQWLLFDNGVEKLAFLHCYMACSTARNDDYLAWNEDLFHMMSQEIKLIREQGFIVMSMGDFNSKVGNIAGLEMNRPTRNSNGNMFLNFVSQSSLFILNTLPIAKGTFTRFMDDTSTPESMSLLDYGLLDHDKVHTVTSFAIDSEARHACGSDHGLLVATLTFSARARVNWSFQEGVKFNIRDHTKYDKYQGCLDEVARSIPIHEFDNLSIEGKLAHINRSIMEAGTSSIGVVTCKKRTKNRTLPKVDFLNTFNI